MEMEMAIGTASWLVDKVMKKLSVGSVAAYLASSELRLNDEQIKTDPMYTLTLLHEAQGRYIINANLQGPLQEVIGKANEAEDALDKLHYYIIQDKLDNTHHATPFLGADIQEIVQPGNSTTRSNWISCFSCCRKKEDDDCATDTAGTHNTQNQGNSNSADDSGHLDRFAFGAGNSRGPHDQMAFDDYGSSHLDWFAFGAGNSSYFNRFPFDGADDNSRAHDGQLTFDRVAMSKKIKSVIEVLHSACLPVTDFLKSPDHISTRGTSVTLKRPPMELTIARRHKLYGRSALFETTIQDITGATYHSETLYVLPIVGPGGIGKTTFTQHLYNNKRIEDHFNVRVWVSTSTDFDVLKLTQQIHNSIPTTEKEESNNITIRTTNLDLLQKSIAHRLNSGRFLIVLDDMWKCYSHAEWETLLAPFTNGKVKGNMVIVTTRYPIVKERVMKLTVPINLLGLEPAEFLEFFQACIYGENKTGHQYSELEDIGTEIAKALKCSPLAAETTARLLKENLSRKHWSEVLQNNEWKNQTKKNDIIPTLKRSYDYLPFHLKQCFSHFSLFPEDHRFRTLEMNRFWTAIGIIDSSGRNNYLDELVGYGFLVKEDINLENPSYVMHDFLHDLSTSVSSRECLNISNSLSFRVDEIPESIQHVSITMKDIYDEKFRKEMAKMKRLVNIKNLRTLMIFEKYQGSLLQILMETFKDIESLRVLFVLMPLPEFLPINFSKLIHLRYLSIRHIPYFLSRGIARCSHLVFLDLHDSLAQLPKDISRLVNLRRFISHAELHSNISEVGKIEHLEDLKEFNVKRDIVGFELEELGKLRNLEGQLCLKGLERVETKEEANKAKLRLKINLRSLKLVWGIKLLDNNDDDVVDGLQPHANLRKLAIEDHGCDIGRPVWLFHGVTISYLESLRLNGVSWGTLPPFVQLPRLKILGLRNIAGVRLIGPDLMNLEEVTFHSMPDLEEWFVGPDSQQFTNLASINFIDCPNLVTMPFLLDPLGPSAQDRHYPSLTRLAFSECPRLSMPSFPPTSNLRTATMHGITPRKWNLFFEKPLLRLWGYTGALNFHNTGGLERVEFSSGSRIPWTELEKLTSLRELTISDDSGMHSMDLLRSFTSLCSLALINCENLRVKDFNPLITVNLKELYVFNTLKSIEENGRPLNRSIAVGLLSELVVARTKHLLPADSFHQLETLTVDCISGVLVAPLCRLFAAALKNLGFWFDRRYEILTEEQERALQLLTSLQKLEIHECPALPSLPQGLHNLPSLQILSVKHCPKIRSLPKGGFPTSLRKLTINYDGWYKDREILRESYPDLQLD